MNEIQKLQDKITELKDIINHTKRHNDYLVIQNEELEAKNVDLKAIIAKNLEETTNIRLAATKEIKRLQDLQDAWEYVNMPKEIPIPYSTLLTRVRDLETQNKILIETGHWIGQDEAHDLKVAVKKFLGYARTGLIGGDNNPIFNVPSWQMEELVVALDNCK